MASIIRFSGDETFFARLSTESKKEGEDYSKENAKNEAKVRRTRNSKSAAAAAAAEDTQSEKKTAKKAEAKKGGRQTRAREPLKPINTFEDGQEHLEVPQPKAAGRKSTKLSPSPSKGKKENQISHKIIIYEDARTEIYTMAKEEGKKASPRLPKSSEKEKPKKEVKGRAKSEEKKKTRATSLEPPKTRGRSSMNDLAEAKPAGEEKKKKERKSAKPAKKTPSKPRVSKKVSAEPIQLPPGLSDVHLEAIARLESMFPNVDPEYLRSQYLQHEGSIQDTISDLVVKEKTDELPTKADYIKRMESVNLQSKYTTDFSVENFLKIIPDPWEYFLKVEKHNCPRYAEHSLHYLKNKFKKHYAQNIQSSLIKHDYSLYLTHKDLSKNKRNVKMRTTNRSKYECDANKPTKFDLQFLQEVAFIENEKEIRAYIKKTEANKYKMFKEAQKTGEIFECDFCSRSNLLWNQIVNCPAQHVFCKDCVTKRVEEEMKKESFQLKCLVKCDEELTMEYLQNALSSDLTAKIIRRIQLEEIKPAGIEDLVYCPFCYYVTIMSPELTVVKCLNLSCMKETCRECKKINHIPLKCNELENFEMEKTLIEDEKIDTNHPTCVQCKKEFVKEEDSNRMACPCGATICYICRQPYPDCPHFDDDHSQPSGDHHDQPDISTTIHVEDFLEPQPENEDSHDDGSNDLSASPASETSETSDVPTELFHDFAFTDSHFY